VRKISANKFFFTFLSIPEIFLTQNFSEFNPENHK